MMMNKKMKQKAMTMIRNKGKEAVCSLDPCTVLRFFYRLFCFAQKKEGLCFCSLEEKKIVLVNFTKFNDQWVSTCDLCVA